MKRFILLLSFSTLGPASSFGQAGVAQKEINEQVWKPFIKSFSSGDDEGFRVLHSKDVIRVIQDSKQIMGCEQYFKRVPDSIKTKWGNWKKNIELRFIQCIASNDKAFEVGYHKTTSTNVLTHENRTGYGKFHVLLRKENGVWKILMDADANEKTDENIFLTGESME